MSPLIRRTATQSLLLLGIAAAACGLVSSATEPAPARPIAPRAAVAPPAAPQVTPASLFSWSDVSRLRDPFQVRAPGLPPITPHIDGVTLSTTPLDQLHLMAVVASERGPVAMVTDPRGFGTALHRGMYVAQAETLDGGPDRGVCVVHWRVARIRASHLRRETDGRLHEVPADVSFERVNPCASNEVSERTLTMPATDEPDAMQGTFRVAQR